MARSRWLHILIAVAAALAVLLFVRLRHASGAPLPSESISAGHDLKVFMKTSHHRMPNLIITPAQADDLTNYILSLKRN